MPMNSKISFFTKKAVKKGALPGAWLAVSLLFFVGALNYLDRTTIITMHESITNAFTIDDAQFGLLTSVFLWTYGILSPFAGFLADRFSRSRVIIGSLFVWSIVTLLTGFAATFGQLLATRALMGISEACYIPAALALISDYHRGATRSLATGVNMVGIQIGSSLGFIGGWIAETYHWSLAFHIFGAVGILYSIIVVFTLHDPPVEKKDLDINDGEVKINLWVVIKNLFSNSSFILMLVFWGLLGAVGWILVGLLPTYYQSHFQISQTMAGIYATAYFYPFAIVGLLLGGFLADRWSEVNMRGRILVPVIGLCIAAPGVFIASGTNLPVLAVAFFAIYPLTRMFTDANFMPILRLVADERYSATGYGILNLLATIVGGIGIYAGGVLKDVNINLSFTFKIAATLMIICAILLYFVKPKQELLEAQTNET
jgi:MFS family permease